MTLTRRNLLKETAVGAAIACCTSATGASAAEREEKVLPPKAVGLLFDSTLCVGCKACETACREANHTHPEFPGKEKLWDAPLDLSPNTLTVIKVYSDGAGEHKDQEQDGYAFVKKSCMHCVDPSCVSVCPVTAMTKDPQTGIVSYNPGNCIGCRYCVAACPFGVPQFEFDKSFPRLRKCEMCKDRQAEGEIPACAEACPAGATLFGPVTALREEAERRHQLQPGETAFFPRGRVDSTDVVEKRAAHYLQETYGLTEVGGAQMNLLAGVPFEKLGYPKLPNKPFVSTSEHIQHTLYKGMIAPAVLFGTLLFMVRRNAGREKEDTGHGHEENLKPLAGPWITRTTVIAGAMVALLGLLMMIRFVFGLGATTNLNNGIPWGIWLAYDMVAGSAIGCGGYAVALLVYALNKGHYHPLVRPAIVASMFGYGLGGLSVILDISRWWNAWHIMWPAFFNFNSVMIEVALCVSIYTSILALEFSPAVVEKLVEWTGRRGGNLHAITKLVQKVLNKAIFVLIALGMTLPTMHQSSLGTMLIPFGNFVHPLWQTPILPALFLLTALSTGFAVVLFEATLVSDRFSRPSEARILGLLSRYMMGVVIAFLALRWFDLIARGRLHYIFTSRGLSLAFLAETAFFVAAVILLRTKERRMNQQFQFIAALCLLAGGILYRVDSYLVAYNRPGWHYFPSVPELLVTFGMIAVEVLGYVLIVKFFPVLPSVERAKKLVLAGK